VPDEELGRHLRIGRRRSRRGYIALDDSADFGAVACDHGRVTRHDGVNWPWHAGCGCA
jgi:hypothetical protein